MNPIEKRKEDIKNAYNLMKNSTPEAYPQARINYYTLKDGQGWLRSEKERIANIEIDPIINSLSKKLEQSIPKEPEDTTYIQRRLLEEKDKVGVVSRSFELGITPKEDTSSWYSYILNLLIAFFAIGCIYLLFSGKLLKISRLFYPNNTI